MSAGEGERLSRRGGPEAGDDGELLLEAVEALTHRRERDAVGGVLVVVPAGADAKLHPATGHVVDVATLIASGPGSRKVAEVTRVPSRMVEVSRASPARVVQASDGPGRPLMSPIFR